MNALYTENIQKIYKINVREYRIKNGQSRETGNIQDEDNQNKNTTQYVLYTTIGKTQDKDKQNKNTTQYVLDTTIGKTQDKDNQNKNTTQYVLYTTIGKTKKNKQKHNTICVRHH